MNAIREYVTIKTAPYLSKEAIAILISNIEYMACDRSDLYKPIRSNIDNPLRSPGLRHLAWNVGERLGVSLAKRAVFIKSSLRELNPGVRADRINAGQQLVVEPKK